MIYKHTHPSLFKDIRSRIRNPKGHDYAAIQIVLIIGLSLSTVCLGMRLYMKNRLCNNLGKEDRKPPIINRTSLVNIRYHNVSRTIETLDIGY